MDNDKSLSFNIGLLKLKILEFIESGDRDQALALSLETIDVFKTYAEKSEVIHKEFQNKFKK